MPNGLVLRAFRDVSDSPSHTMNFLHDLYGDYVRHGSRTRNLAFWAIATYRFGNYANTLSPPFKWAGGKIYGVLSLAVEMSSGIMLNREARVGKDLHLVHSGNIKIHPASVIGDRVGIMHDVTLGTGGDRDGAPVIGDDVFIGAGAKVLGPIKIGNRARIAANSLVISDVPPDATAIGVPAKVLRYTGSAHSARSTEILTPPILSHRIPTES
jgi:serine O-acetyltransferase